MGEVFGSGICAYVGSAGGIVRDNIGLPRDSVSHKIYESVPFGRYRFGFGLHGVSREELFKSGVYQRRDTRVIHSGFGAQLCAARRSVAELYSGARGVSLQHGYDIWVLREDIISFADIIIQIVKLVRVGSEVQLPRATADGSQVSVLVNEVSAPVYPILAYRTRFAEQQRQHVMAVKLRVRGSGNSKDRAHRGEHIHMRSKLVLNNARGDYTGPAGKE